MALSKSRLIYVPIPIQLIVSLFIIQASPEAYLPRNRGVHMACHLHRDARGQVIGPEVTPKRHR